MMQKHTVQEPSLHLEDQRVQSVKRQRQEESLAHLLSIMQFFHEARVFLHTRDTKGLRLRADSIHKVVVRDSRAGN